MYSENKVSIGMLPCLYSIIDGYWFREWEIKSFLVPMSLFKHGHEFRRTSNVKSCPVNTLKARVRWAEWDKNDATFNTFLLDLTSGGKIPTGRESDINPHLFSRMREGKIQFVTRYSKSFTNAPNRLKQTDLELFS